MLLGKLPAQAKQIILFTREAALDANHLHRVIHVRGFHVPDGTGNIEDELEYFCGTRQRFWRRMDFARENAMKEITVEVFFDHLINVNKTGLALRVAGLKHDE